MGKAKNRIEYYELSKAAVSSSRNIVISECSKGGFTIAQQLAAEEGNGKITTVFMRGAFHVDDIHGMYNLRDAINLAIKTFENNESKENPEDEEDWDEEGW